jgi:hypothetical protein
MSLDARISLMGAAAIAPGSRSTEIEPAAPRRSGETPISRSEKIVSGIAISVLMAGFATGILGISPARGFRSEPHVAHLEHDTHRRDR